MPTTTETDPRDETTFVVLEGGGDRVVYRADDAGVAGGVLVLTLDEEAVAIYSPGCWQRVYREDVVEEPAPS